jgi:hypothetical protein
MWRGGAVPVPIAYAAVLESLDKYAIYFMSDNMDQRGDVHIGPMSTREFAKWCYYEGLGQFQTTGLVESLRTGKNLQGWMMTPNWLAIHAVVKKHREELITMIKELNKHDNIKERHTSRTRARERRSRALAEGLVAGWATTTAP